MIARPGAAGFTLIEALIALAVLAVASAGLIRATEAHVDLIRGLQQRAVAGWVAENRLVELSLPGLPPPPPVETMLGQRWRVATMVQPTGDPDLVQVTVSVVPDQGEPVATLRGFVDRGASQ